MAMTIMATRIALKLKLGTREKLLAIVDKKNVECLEVKALELIGRSIGPARIVIKVVDD